MMTKAQRRAVYALQQALDIADRLIERAYGTDLPNEWNEAFAEAAEACRRAEPRRVARAQETSR